MAEVEKLQEFTRLYVIVKNTSLLFSYSELEESLLVLPFSYVRQFLELLNEFIDRQWEVELACRCLFFLLKWVELFCDLFYRLFFF